MDAVVVGGGIVGLASAYYLAERGVEVTVLEKGSLGAGSTERSAGGIRQQFSTPVNVALSRASVDVWESFAERFGVDVAYRQTGYLFLAREEATADAFRETVSMQQARGVDSRLLDPAAATAHCEGLDPEPFLAATYCPTDGFADPHLALQGFAGAAREAGAEVRTGTAVRDVLREGDRVVGVEVDGTGQRRADFVVNAAGPWAGEVAAMAGVDLPVAPKRRQVLVVDPERPVPEADPLTIDLDTGAYFRPEREGAALVGGEFGGSDPDVDPDGFDRGIDLDWAAEAVERASDVAAYFGPESRIRRGWAGLYAVTPDHHAILDESVPGLVTAAGFSGHGFQHAPATGRVVSELVCEGEASLVDVSALASDRFADGDLREERNVA